MICWDLKCIIFNSGVAGHSECAAGFDSCVRWQSHCSQRILPVRCLFHPFFYSWWDVDPASIWHFVSCWCLKEWKIRWLNIFRRWEQHCPVETCSSVQGVTTLPSCSGLHSHLLLHIYVRFLKDFTPDLQQIYTDISVVSVKLCNSVFFCGDK